MKRSSLLCLVWLLASCYAPDYPAQYRCSTERPTCPAGLRCNGSNCVPALTADGRPDAPLDQAGLDRGGDHERGTADRPAGDLRVPDLRPGDGLRPGELRADLPRGDLPAWPDVLSPPDLAAPCPSTSCLIGGSCFGPGVVNGACGVCDPTLVRSAWSPGPGCVSTLVKGLSGPYGVTAGAGKVYVAETGANRILLIQDGQAVVIAGSSHAPSMQSFDAGYYYVSSYLNGNGAAALFNAPSDLTVLGNVLYVVDQNNNVIRRVSLSAPYTVTTAAGPPAPVAPAAPANEAPRGFIDGALAAARFHYPFGIDRSSSAIYVADRGNRAVRSVDPAGLVATVTGSSFSAALTGPGDVVLVGTNFFITDNQRILAGSINNPTALLATVAGLAGATGSIDGVGPAARFKDPIGLVVGPGKLYVADSGNHRIRQMDLATDQVTTLAGSVQGFQDGPMASARFSGPYGLGAGSTSAGAYYLFIADTGNGAIRVLRPF